MTKQGRYIVIEGLDGSGKTTQFENLAQHLGEQIVSVREPGGTSMSEHIRSILKDKAILRSPQTNIFLFAAARAELIANVIRPAVQAGKTIISDRNWLSSVAYQTAEGADPAYIITVNKLATEEFFIPDLLLFFDATIETCQNRLHGRAGTETDYFDEKGRSYFEKVRAAYLEHVQQLPHYRVIDANGTVEDIAKAVRAAVGS